MKARNINDIVKSASRSSQGRMQIIKCQSDLLLKIGFWCSVLSTSYLPGNKQQIAGTNSRRITMLSIQLMSASRENSGSFYHLVILKIYDMNRRFLFTGSRF